MKIATVCGLGMGTSLMLKMNVESILKKHGIHAEIEHYDVSSVNQITVDYIITSNELQSIISNKAPIICIKNFFDKNEIEKIFLENNIISEK